MLEMVAVTCDNDNKMRDGQGRRARGRDRCRRWWRSHQRRQGDERRLRVAYKGEKTVAVSRATTHRNREENNNESTLALEEGNDAGGAVAITIKGLERATIGSEWRMKVVMVALDGGATRMVRFDGGFNSGMR
ncbi:hypothetical protein SESBI_20589 [Sesbania bispinosa]|nr:hypothetical protein SESBI_20589 [Sesbania bispinosa]